MTLPFPSAGLSSGIPTTGTIFGDLAGISNNASGILDIADAQAQLMQRLGQTLESLGSSLPTTSATGQAMQTQGNLIQQEGMRFHQAFTQQSDFMGKNASYLGNTDQDNSSHIMSQIGQLS